MTQSTAEIESVETRTSSTGWLQGTRVPGSSVATSRPATCSMRIGSRSSAQTRFSPSRLRTQRWPGGRRGCLETGGSILSAKVSCTCLPRLPVTPDISTQRARSRDHRWQAMDGAGRAGRAGLNDPRLLETFRRIRQPACCDGARRQGDRQARSRDSCLPHDHRTLTTRQGRSRSRSSADDGPM
jgi:hypothetical protein